MEDGPRGPVWWRRCSLLSKVGETVSWWSSLVERVVLFINHGQQLVQSPPIHHHLQSLLTAVNFRAAYSLTLFNPLVSDKTWIS